MMSKKIKNAIKLVAFNSICRSENLRIVDKKKQLLIMIDEICYAKNKIHLGSLYLDVQ